MPAIVRIQSLRFIWSEFYRLILFATASISKKWEFGIGMGRERCGAVVFALPVRRKCSSAFLLILVKYQKCISNILSMFPKLKKWILKIRNPFFTCQMWILEIKNPLSTCRSTLFNIKNPHFTCQSTLSNIRNPLFKTFEFSVKSVKNTFKSAADHPCSPKLFPEAFVRSRRCSYLCARK